MNFFSKMLEDGAAEWHMRARVATGIDPRQHMRPPFRSPPPRASFANCVHTLHGIETRFQRVAERNCRKHAGRGPHIPMAYCTATLRSMAQTASLSQCWVAAEEALR